MWSWWLQDVSTWQEEQRVHQCCGCEHQLTFPTGQAELSMLMGLKTQPYDYTTAQTFFSACWQSDWQCVSSEDVLCIVNTRCILMAVAVCTSLW